MNKTVISFVQFTAFVVLGTVILGSIVCVTDSSAACPNWPGCYEGQITPELNLHPIIEFIHRVFSVSCGPTILISAILLRKHADLRVRLLPWLALAGALGAGVFGMLTIKRGLSSFEAMLDLWCAFIALVAMTIVVALLSDKPASSTPVLGFGTTIALFLLHGTGILVAGPGSFTRCMGWPLSCNTTSDEHIWLQIIRIFIAIAAIIGIVLIKSRLLWVVLGVEAVLGVLLLVLGLNDAIGSAFSATAAGILALVSYSWGLSVKVVHNGKDAPHATNRPKP